MENSMDLQLREVRRIVSSYPVAVFSKSFCPSCTRIIELLSSLGVRRDRCKIIEMDYEPDGGEIQDALHQLTEQRNVPHVFIGGVHITGHDILQLQQNGELVARLNEFGAFLPPTHPRGGPSNRNAWGSTSNLKF